MKLSEMKQLLAAGDLKLTKSLGQNFLHDANQLRRIVQKAELRKSDKVLEIGPGLGPLTERLLEQAGEVLAIEKDGRLVEILKKRFNLPVQTGGTSVLRIIHEDALVYLRREAQNWSDWKLVANLPYSVASPLLVELAQQGSRGPERMVVTLQSEVATRLMAQAGDEDYGLLTLLVQLDYEPREWFKIPASCFFPEPEVDSACVCLLRRSPALLPAEWREAFVRIAKRSFSQRRKRMLKLLKKDWPPDGLELAFREIGLLPDTRAEQVSLEQFIRLNELLAPVGQPTEELFDVVNERDEVIGCQPRRMVHRLGLQHRAAHVLVFNARGQVFLQKRSLNKDRQPGLWDSSASGHVNCGEDYDVCAIRELNEELGLQLDAAPTRLFKLAASPETDQEHVWVYRGRAEGPFRLAPDEIERGEWYDPEDVTRWMAERPQDFASTVLVIWKIMSELSSQAKAPV